MTQDQLYTIQVNYSKALGPSKINLYWESDSQDFDLISSDYLYFELNSGYTPFSFQVVPASTNQTTSYLNNYAAA